MGTAKWTWIAIGYQTLLAYVFSLVLFQIGRLFLGFFTFGTIIGIIVIGIMIYLIFIKKRPERYLVENERIIRN
jgi:ferrous iron transport protein B